MSGNATPQRPVTGGCLCGAIRWQASAAPLGVRTCWCRLCQYLAAGSATVNIVFPAEAVRIDGPLATFEGVADSGNPMQRGFCPRCGTQISSYTSARPHLMILRAGTLDDPKAIDGPQDVIWAGAAPEWAPIDPTLPRHEAQAPPVG
jgi:hypothetical protein